MLAALGAAGLAAFLVMRRVCAPVQPAIGVPLCYVKLSCMTLVSLTLGLIRDTQGPIAKACHSLDTHAT